MGRIWKLIRYKNVDKPKNFNDKTRLGWNIYNGKELGATQKKFHNIHYKLKYKLIAPGLILVRRIFKKSLDKEIPDEWYNKDIQLFDKSFDEALRVWCETCLACNRDNSRNQTRTPYATPEEVEEMLAKKESVKQLRTIKQLTTTMALNDTVYREFLTCLMHRIADNMHTEYCQSDKEHTERYHLTYTSAATFDILYYVIGKDINNGFTLRPARPQRFVTNDDANMMIRRAVSESLREMLRVEEVQQ